MLFRSAVAKVLADPKALDKLRVEFKAYGDIADKKLDDATTAAADAAAKLADVSKLGETVAARDNDVSKREELLKEGTVALNAAREQFTAEKAAALVAAEAAEKRLAEREAAVAEREATVQATLDEAFKEREIALDRRATDASEKENRLTLLAQELADREAAVHVRELQAKTILDKAAALSALAQEEKANEG